MPSSKNSPRYARLKQVLAEERQKAGLTQVELSARLKRPQSFVSKYEGGERRVDVVEFIEICEALGANPKTVIRKIVA